MATVLVVDDSTVDRSLVKGILASGGELQVEFAENGVLALARIEQSTPDVVVTDLMMPEMDGLQVVQCVRRQHPELPVVVMTGLGSEETAIEALQLGAASFVPKSRLSDRLLDTIKQVLALRHVDHPFGTLMQCLAETAVTFHLQSQLVLIPQLVDLVRRALASMAVCDATECIRLSLALEEALLNALVHGSFELSSDAGSTEARPSAECFQMRSREQPYCDRKIYVHLELSTSDAKFVVRDEGRGFDVAALPTGDDLSPFQDGCGRGLALMRSFMDRVTFNDTGNQVTLARYFQSQACSAKAS